MQLPSPAAFRVLRHVARHGPLSASAVAAGLGIPSSTAAYHLSRLCKRGLLLSTTIGRRPWYHHPDGAQPTAALVLHDAGLAELHAFLLAHAGATTREIVDALGAPRATVSSRLALLRRHGLVEAERNGRVWHYRARNGA